MELDRAVAYARQHQKGVLLTLKADGRPQASNIMYAVGDDGVVRISATADRAKSTNARRDPQVSLHVTAEDFWSYVVLGGDAEVTPTAAAPDDATVDELVEVTARSRASTRTGTTTAPPWWRTAAS
ncbi:MAG: TIGR03618 family F420-dependent PPOX class oxidoreductase [Acidimicrobiales bacterium]